MNFFFSIKNEQLAEKTVHYLDLTMRTHMFSERYLIRPLEAPIMKTLRYIITKTNNSH